MHGCVALAYRFALVALGGLGISTLLLGFRCKRVVRSLVCAHVCVCKRVAHVRMFVRMARDPCIVVRCPWWRAVDCADAGKKG